MPAYFPAATCCATMSRMKSLGAGDAVGSVLMEKRESFPKAAPHGHVQQAGEIRARVPERERSKHRHPQSIVRVIFPTRMKPHLFLPLLVALSLPTFAADEKSDPGPKPTPEEEKAFAELAKRGALAQPVAQGANWRYVNFRGVEKPDAALFALLKPCALIVELDLSGVTLTDADLANVAGLKNLRRLNLARTAVTDAGLAHLKGLAQIESLNLFQTKITDAGLAQLSGLKNLKRLYVFESKVTEAAAKNFEKTIAGLKVDTGWKLPPATPPPVKVASAATPAPKPATPAPKPATPATKPAPPAAKPATPAPKPEVPKPAPAPVAAKPSPSTTGPGPKPSADEEKAYAELVKRGASADPLAAGINWRYVNFRGVEKPDAATFALLKPCSLIVELNLSGAKLGDADLGSVAGLKNLEKLNLSRSNVTDAALAHLKPLANLESLNLFGTTITDAGLANLQPLKSLKRLYVAETKVTDAGVKALQAAVPDVKIERAPALPPPAPKPEEKKATPAPAPKPAAPTAKPEEKKPAPAPAPAAPKLEQKKDAPPAK